MTARAEPLGGRLLTRPYYALLTIVGIAMIILAWRFMRGIGSTTALSDTHPWGLWIAFDVVTGAAMATGGYAVALLVYVLNQGKYHPLIRSALVTSALGYSFAGISVVIDLGRWWNVWRVPLFPWFWNVSSVLLEVALCIMLYTIVVWIELAPAFFEKAKSSKSNFLNEWAAYFAPKLEKVLPFLIALGILLPTMHQSSLGSLMLIAGDKLHPLWQTPLLPLLFLVSCIAMGYAAVIVESNVTAFTFKLDAERKMLNALRTPMRILLGAYVAVRLVDVFARGKSSFIFSLDRFALFFWLEIALFAAGILLLMKPGTLRTLFRAGAVVLLGGAFYRFATFLLAFDPGDGSKYFPSVPEIIVTLGVVAGEIALYLLLIKKLPILAALPKRVRVRVRPVPFDALMAEARHGD
jgi:Ni/Fe-hydrogenase subunit HybB-like protein